MRKPSPFALGTEADEAPIDLVGDESEGLAIAIADAPDVAERMRSRQVDGAWVRLRVAECRGIAVVSFADIALINEMEIREVDRELRGLLEGGHHCIILCFDRVVRLSSQVIAMVLNVHRRCTAAGGLVKICQIHPDLREVFALTGVFLAVDIYPDLRAALASDWPAPALSRPSPQVPPARREGHDTPPGADRSRNRRLDLGVTGSSANPCSDAAGTEHGFADGNFSITPGKVLTSSGLPCISWDPMDALPLPEIPAAERTPLVTVLLEIIQQQAHRIQVLEDEIARLKGLKPRPQIQPSRLEQPAPGGAAAVPRPEKRPGSSKKNKTQVLTIHQTVLLPPGEIPPAARFKGYEDYMVQDLVIRPQNTLYRRERWQVPGGPELLGELPAAVRGRHFGPGLITYVLYQYHHQHVTQPLLHEQLTDLGIDISAGQINRIITEGHEPLHHEAQAVLRTGLESARVLHVDDTQARHQGQNGYCTHIGNDLFSWFGSTASKSRINILSLLRAGHTDYVVNDEALDYIRHSNEAGGVVAKVVAQLEGLRGLHLADDQALQATLQGLGIRAKHQVKIITEGALLGSAVAHGLSPETIFISDEAPQYRLLVHGLCWLHAERPVARMIGMTAEHRAAIAAVRQEIWELYQGLKAYRQGSAPDRAEQLRAGFRALVGTARGFAGLDQALLNLGAHESELLLVLEHPEAPLHNNLSENAIRDYAKKRKISGSTRNEAGRRSRDTFASLKKTCRKLGISFWSYLTDRVERAGGIAALPALMRQKATAPG